MRSRSQELTPTESRNEQPKQPEKLPVYMREVMIFARVRFKAIRESQPDVWRGLEDRKKGGEAESHTFIPDVVCGASIADSALTPEDRDYIAHLEFDTVEAALQGLISLGFRKENLSIEKVEGSSGSSLITFKDGSPLTSLYSQVPFDSAPDKSARLTLGKIFLDVTATEHLAAGNI